MSESRVVTVRDLRQGDSNRTENRPTRGELVSSGPGWVELDFTSGATIPPGTPIEVQTEEILYLGHVQSEKRENGRVRLRVHVDHFLSLQSISAIQKRWNQDQAD